MTDVFIIRNQQVFDNCLKTIHAIPRDKAFEIRISEPNKSAAQRNYLHKLIDIVAAYIGERPEDLKDRLKLEWLPLHEVKANGQTYLMPPSTEKLTKVQYSLLIEKTLLLCSQLGLVVPDPAYYGYEQKDIYAKRKRGT